MTMGAPGPSSLPDKAAAHCRRVSVSGVLASVHGFVFLHRSVDAIAAVYGSTSGRIAVILGCSDQDRLYFVVLAPCHVVSFGAAFEETACDVALSVRDVTLLACDGASGALDGAVTACVVALSVRVGPITACSAEG